MTPLHIGSARFDIPLEVEEGGVQPIEFFDDSCLEFDAVNDLTANIDSETEFDSDLPPSGPITDSDEYLTTRDGVKTLHKEDPATVNFPADMDLRCHPLIDPWVQSSVMEGEKIQKSDLQVLPVVDTNDARDGESKKRAANDGSAQPSVNNSDPSAEANSSSSARPGVAHPCQPDFCDPRHELNERYLNGDASKDHARTLLNSAMNSGVDYLSMPICADDARTRYLREESNYEHEA
ncbi:hypothetical protein B0H11DRAFT_2293084 [Mycena galericulata]|nr:hypothetical protein B0H11DRAFT_2293084 [Mycena galericulata]